MIVPESFGLPSCIWCLPKSPNRAKLSRYPSLDQFEVLPMRNPSGLLLLAFVSLSLLSLSSQDSEKPKIEWKKGPTIWDLGGVAEINVPKGYLFTDKKGTQTLLELTHNLPSGDEVGALVPATEAQDWFVIFEFDQIGLVKDEEKDKLNADGILDSIQRGTEEANSERKRRGWSEFHVVGWERSPFYDDQTHNLTWAIRGRSDTGGPSVNHSVRLLGRRGIMRVDLVMKPEEYAASVSDFNRLLAGFTFQQGNRYADFVRGDKVAEYGLTALILGGAGAAAVKTGLLAKAWRLVLVAVLALKKLIIVVFAGLAAVLRKIWRWITGRKQEHEEPLPSVESKVETLPLEPRTGDQPDSDPLK